MSHAKLASGMADIKLDKTAAPTRRARGRGKPPVLVVRLEEGFVLAYSTHQLQRRPKFSHEKKTGSTRLDRERDIKPETPKAATR